MGPSVQQLERLKRGGRSSKDVRRKSRDLGGQSEGCTVKRPKEQSSSTARSHTLKGTFFWGCLFLGLHPQHMEVPRLGVQSEL